MPFVPALKSDQQREPWTPEASCPGLPRGQHCTPVIYSIQATTGLSLSACLNMPCWNLKKKLQHLYKTIWF